MSAVCPYCRTEVQAEEADGVNCSSCGTPHHVDCYMENGGCTVYGCANGPAPEPKLEVSGGDLQTVRTTVPAGAAAAAAAAAAPSLHPSAGTSTRLAAPPPPPPPFPSSALSNRPVSPPPPPPPAHAGTILPGAIAESHFAGNGAGPAAAAGASPAAVEARLSSMVPSVLGLSGPAPAIVPIPPTAKSRSAYILLGFFLGFLGIHNFYAGYKRKAYGQLALTVLTVFLAGVISWIWAIYEICTVDCDSRGIYFE